MNTSPRDILRKYWGYDQFRPLQEEIIASVMGGKDTLALLPTGGGKSICYQVPGMVMEGLVIVVSPLIALMRDQVEGLNRRGIAATYINSTLSRRVIDTKLDTAGDGGYKFLYIAPERISAALFRERITRMQVSFIAVDEAHCVSQWGYDFRPHYLRISELRDLLPQLPLMALTASATEMVKKDIQDKLKMRQPNVFVKSFRRENIAWQVLPTDNPARAVVGLSQREQGSGIVYARTRKLTERVSEVLKENGISAAAYHAGLEAAKRAEIQEQWLKGDIRVIAATNAFGMGIDKPDVRFVLHYNLPSDPESYYQEAGRAGRDGAPAKAIALTSPSDIAELKRWVQGKYPSFDEVRMSYEALANFFKVPAGAHPQGMMPFDAQQIAGTFKLALIPFYNSIRLLDGEGVIVWQELPSAYATLQVTAAPDEVLRYKDEHPSMAKLVDFVLRTLGGDVFTEFRRFDPWQWARKLGLSYEVMDEQLHILAMRGLADYQPALDRPSIAFAVPRQPITRNLLNWAKYNFLQKLSEERLDALLKYAETPPRQCRGVMLESYFGEKGAKPCGVCDYCTEKNAPYPDAQLMAELIPLISERSRPFAEVLDQTWSGTRTQRETLLRRWMDEKKLEVVNFGEIRIRKKN